MSDNTEDITHEYKKKIRGLSKIFRENYANTYQSILEGRENKLLNSIALHLEIPAEDLRNMFVIVETEKILRDLDKSQGELEALMLMVENMKHSP